MGAGKGNGMIEPSMIRKAFGEYREGEAQALTREDCKGSTLWKTPRRKTRGSLTRIPSEFVLARRMVGSEDARKVLANDAKRMRKANSR